MYVQRWKSREDLTENSGHRRDWARRRPPLRRLCGLHAPCNPGSSAYIAWDTESGDESRVGTAGRLSAMGTDDASVLVQLISLSFSGRVEGWSPLKPTLYFIINRVCVTSHYLFYLFFFLFKNLLNLHLLFLCTFRTIPIPNWLRKSVEFLALSQIDKRILYTFIK